MTFSRLLPLLLCLGLASPAAFAADAIFDLWVDALTALGGRLMEAEAYDDAADISRRIVSADELNEDAHRQLMAALARAGHRGEALRHYDRLATLLQRELEAEPDGQTTLLYDRLRRAEPV